MRHGGDNSYGKDADHKIGLFNDFRTELRFEIIGYVLMSEHCHLLIWPDAQKPSQARFGCAAR
jgi:REP element-mobilizing transposase RayT